MTLFTSKGGFGVTEDDDVASGHMAIGQEPLRQAGRRREDLPVEEQKISDQQRSLHAFRGNKDRLQDEREHERAPRQRSA